MRTTHYVIISQYRSTLNDTGSSALRLVCYFDCSIERLRALVVAAAAAADGARSNCRQLSASNGLRSAVPYVQIAGDPVAGQFSVNDRRAPLRCLGRRRGLRRPSAESGRTQMDRRTRRV